MLSSENTSQLPTVRDNISVPSSNIEKSSRKFGNYQSTLPNIPQERRYHLHCGGGLKSRGNPYVYIWNEEAKFSNEFCVVKKSVRDKVNLYCFANAVSTLLCQTMFCWPCIVVNQYSKTNVTHISFNLLRIKASIYFKHYFLILRRRYTSGTWYIACVLSVGCTLCFEHYLLILRRRYTSGTWYIACVLCQLAAPGLQCFTILIYYDARSTKY
jgi:hypothetical protein